ncbi:MAG: hypothetical protein ACYTGS_09510, partial [Planctomycetota bacterium]
FDIVLSSKYASCFQIKNFYGKRHNRIQNESLLYDLPSAMNMGRMNTASFPQNAQHKQLTANHEAQTPGSSLTCRSAKSPQIHIILTYTR